MNLDNITQFNSQFTHISMENGMLIITSDQNLFWISRIIKINSFINSSWFCWIILRHLTIGWIKYLTSGILCIHTWQYCCIFGYCPMPKVESFPWISLYLAETILDRLREFPMPSGNHCCLALQDVFVFSIRIDLGGRISWGVALWH